MKVMNHLIYAIGSTIPDEGDEPSDICYGSTITDEGDEPSDICYRQYNNR